MLKEPDIEIFHKHLDNCVQCRNQPFNLCRTGQDIIEGRSYVEACKRRDRSEIERTIELRKKGLW